MISLMPRRVDSAFCSLIFGRGTLDAEDFVVTSLCWSSIVLAACPVALGRLVCAHDGISLTCGGMRAPPPQPVNRIADFSELLYLLQKALQKALQPYGMVRQVILLIQTLLRRIVLNSCTPVSLLYATRHKTTHHRSRQAVKSNRPLQDSSTKLR